MKHAVIAAIEYFLPIGELTTGDLSNLFPEWSVDKIDAKTGVHTRHIAAIDEYASDLAVSAARRIFEGGIYNPSDVDFLLLCTQTADYALPSTSCLIQPRLGLSNCTGALDINLGCSGFVYGLGLAEGLIASEQARTVLLVTTDTYSKYINPMDKNCRTIFGDGAAATLLVARECRDAIIGPFVYGTDGTGADKLIVRRSGTHNAPILHTDDKMSAITPDQYLSMDGPSVFAFAFSSVPQIVHEVLRRARLMKDAITLFVFHQANAYLLQAIKAHLDIPMDKLQIAMKHCGNTISSTIPIALKEAHNQGRLGEGDLVLVAGFGVGFSYASTIIRWEPLRFRPEGNRI